MQEKIKITRKEIEELYDIDDNENVKVQEDEVSVKEITEHEETWEEATERKDKEQYGT